MFNLTPYKRRNGIANHDPLGIFDAEGFFDRFFNDAFLPSLRINSYPMRVDVRENEKEYAIEAELPGVKKEEIGIDVTDDMITISVTKNEQVNEENDRYLRRERRYGSMSRSFAIANVDTEAIKAQFEDGVLTVKLPKIQVEKTKSKKVQIN